MSVVLATAGFDHRIRFWEAPSGVCSKIIKFPDSQVNKLEITPDKQFIAAAGNPVIRLYEILAPASSGSGGSATPGGAPGSSTNPQSQQQQQEPQQAVLTLEGHTSNVTSVGFQKDGRYLYSGSEDGTIKVWDLRNPHYSRSFDSKSPVNSVTLRTDRDEFVSGDQNGYVKIWDLGGNGCIHSIRPSTENNTNHHHHQSTTASSTGGGGVGGDDTNNNKSQGRKSRNNKRHSSDGSVPIAAVDISEDSRTLVAVSNKGHVWVWDPTSSSRSGLVPPPSTATGTKTTTDTDDGTGAGADGGVDEESKSAASHTGSHHQQQLLRPITKFRATTPGVYCLHGKIAPDCRHLVTTGSDGLAKLWDTTTWELTKTLDNNNGNNGSSINNKWVWDAAFCADSSYLVTASSDHVARLWNLRNNTVVRKYHGHQSAVTCVALNDSSV